MTRSVCLAGYKNEVAVHGIGDAANRAELWLHVVAQGLGHVFLLNAHLARHLRLGVGQHHLLKRALQPMLGGLAGQSLGARDETFCINYNTRSLR